MQDPSPSPDDPDPFSNHKGHPPWFTIPLAFLSGVFLTLAAIVIAYPAHRAARTKINPGACSKLLILIANLLCTGIGIGIGIYVSGFASVAITFPAAMGMQLLSNMVLQTCLGIATYTKNFVVGTLVLTAAVVTLKDIGPKDPGNLPEDKVIAMLLNPYSYGYIVASVLACLFGLCALGGKWVTNNNARLFTYAVIGSSGTVLNATIGKLVQMNLDLNVKVSFGVAYVLNACLCLAINGYANGTLEDPSRFVPVTAGMNLMLTGLAGLCIWGDMERVRYPLAYAMIYILILLGIYDVSDFDFHAASEPQDMELRRQVDVADMVFDALREGGDRVDPVGGRAARNSVSSANSCPPKLQSREVRISRAEKPGSVELLDASAVSEGPPDSEAAAVRF